ncbi:MAG: hypothetical protein RLZZ546_1510 [Bacteroidota bacterium]|jgi:NAD(P)-dependent dehydrogenase (short-subunit alcohol dehydrogenase family)
MESKYILITGVSTGIGNAISENLLQKGHYVIGTIRDKKDAENLQNFNNFFPIVYDLQDINGLATLNDLVKGILKDNGLYGLINNAGMVVGGPLELVSENDFLKQMDINVFAQRRVTNTLLPYLKENSRIVFMSSVSGLFNNPFTGPYCISKHALESMIDIYRRELSLFGIKVIGIEPGPIKTPIWNKSKGSFDKYVNTRYGFILQKADKMIESAERDALDVSEVVTAVNNGLWKENPATRYIVHKKKFLFKLVSQFLPDKIVDSIVSKTIKGGGDKHRKF